ncbi:hypothetical protein ISN44_As06g034670 [Arabidopsis suecica]|uniref:Reverse transcriptase zinc-binding domain-containing protein n=1 Tax=Arabidopsis suecica TaxID=45249 RepID=A0A8T2CFY4_ARASU|nr:hypothetical protein ISN44_As06g034670 [Arabidopsis suecica]
MHVSPLCCLCSSKVETRDHLLLSYVYSRAIWSMELTRFRLSPSPFQNWEVLMCWTGGRNHTSPSTLRKLVTQAIIYATWKQRNNMLHNSQVMLPACHGLFLEDRAAVDNLNIARPSLPTIDHLQLVLPCLGLISNRHSNSTRVVLSNSKGTLQPESCTPLTEARSPAPMEWSRGSNATVTNHPKKTGRDFLLHPSMCTPSCTGRILKIVHCHQTRLPAYPSHYGRWAQTTHNVFGSDTTCHGLFSEDRAAVDNLNITRPSLPNIDHLQLVSPYLGLISDRHLNSIRVVLSNSEGTLQPESCTPLTKARTLAVVEWPSESNATVTNCPKKTGRDRLPSSKLLTVKS